MDEIIEEIMIVQENLVKFAKQYIEKKCKKISELEFKKKQEGKQTYDVDEIIRERERLKRLLANNEK